MLVNHKVTPQHYNRQYPFIHLGEERQCGIRESRLKRPTSRSEVQCANHLGPPCLCTLCSKDVHKTFSVNVLIKYCIAVITFFRGHTKAELVRHSSHCTPNNMATALCKFLHMILNCSMYIYMYVAASYQQCCTYLTYM